MLELDGRIASNLSGRQVAILIDGHPKDAARTVVEVQVIVGLESHQRASGAIDSVLVVERALNRGSFRPHVLDTISSAINIETVKTGHAASLSPMSIRERTEISSV